MKPTHVIKAPAPGQASQGESARKLHELAREQEAHRGVPTSSTQNWQKYCDARLRQFASFR